LQVVLSQLSLSLDGKAFINFSNGNYTSLDYCLPFSDNVAFA